MKTTSLIFCSLFSGALLLFSCGDKSASENQTTGAAAVDSALTKAADAAKTITENAPAANTKTVSAQFKDFALGDAEHYLFEDHDGNTVEFAGSEDKVYSFGEELPESEANEENQGWTSNKELIGKWFTISYFEREQPEYIDGPMVMAKIISKVVPE